MLQISQLIAEVQAIYKLSAVKLAATGLAPVMQGGEVVLKDTATEAVISHVCFS